MVAEWEVAETMFTEFTPHLHDGTSSSRRASHRAALHGKPWRIFVISTFETFYQHFHPEEADDSQFWGTGIFLLVVLDEAKRWRTSGTPISEFRKANGRMVKMDSCDDNMHMVSYTLSPGPQYKSMLMATLLVNGIEDSRWILRFLESLSRLTVHLPQDTFIHTVNFDDHWFADGSNVSGTERGAGFTPVADPYQNGPKFGLLVQCTTMAWNGYMVPRTGEVGKLERAMQRSDILIRRQHYEKMIGKWGFAVLCTLMLWQTMLSYIPFKNPKPIIDIPPRHETATLVTFYINLVDGSHKGLRERITGVVSAQATMRGQDEAWRPSLPVCSPYIHSTYSWRCLNGSRNNFVEMIIEITFRGCRHRQTKPDHAEDGNFYVCKDFPRETRPNTSAWEGQGYYIWSDPDCVAVWGSNVGLAQIISLEHLASIRQWRETDSVDSLATYPVARQTG